MDIVQAAYEGNVQLVKQYLTNENEINKRNEYGETALHSVLMGIVDNPEQSEVGLMIVRLLLSTNIDKNAKDNKGQTALFIAAITNQREITAELLKNKVDVDITNDNNESALSFVLTLQHTNDQYGYIIDLLRRNGAQWPESSYSVAHTQAQSPEYFHSNHGMFKGSNEKSISEINSHPANNFEEYQQEFQHYLPKFS